ncbi:YbaB/EbfC family nucleoid-associated protein [Streptosporangium sp. KLBMP 9127]|nr:YbaB/EbfC family nucleoid-associated protein [Streptosporangium sp. KLBMP 9127]
MTDVFRDTVEDLAAEYDRHLRQVKELFGKLDEVESTVRSDDGMVTVTVGRHGQVRAIELNPRVYRRLSPSELSRSLMTQINQATEAVARQSKELMEPLVPEGLPYEDIFGEGVGLDSFLPQPVELDDPVEFDGREGRAWRAPTP